MSLDSLVNVTISAESRTPTQRGFGTPLLCGYHANFVDRVREYSDPAEMLDDGFTVNDVLYKMAAALVAQNPRPTTFKIGRRALAHTQAIRLTPTNTDEGSVHAVEITFPDGTTETASYTTGAAEAVADICDGLVTALGALTAAAELSVTDDTTHVTVEAATAGDLMSYEVNGNGNLEIEDVTADPGIATDLAAIELADPDWYCLLLDNNGAAEVAAAAAWVDTNKKLFVATVADTEVTYSGVSDDIASTLSDASRARTAVLWHHVLSPEAGCAWAGKVLPKTPGTVTWAYKGLTGVAVSPLTTAQRSTLESKVANYYVRVGGLGVTLDGRVSAPEWIDVVRGIDLLTARVQEAVFALLAGSDKVEFTDPGVATVKAEILGVLQRNTSTPTQPRLLAADPAPTVSAPRVADVSAANKANRTLPDITFQGQLAGAIHKLTITGRLTV